MPSFFINTYRKNTSIAKIILEELAYHGRNLKSRLKYQQANRTILFYPELPSKRSVLTKALKRLNYNITNNPEEKYCASIFWEKITTRKSFSEYPNVNKIIGDTLNSGCDDISKKHVDEMHQQAFGYQTIIDPLTFTGKAVQKSDANAAHDGKIIDCPITQTDDGFVYQIVINNQVNAQQVEDIRVPINKTDIPFVYKKYRSIDDRFSNKNQLAELHETNTVFSEDEIDNIKLFSVLMGLDYGEMDILRDRDSNKIYIVDVNYTPWGPPNHLNKENYDIALQRLSESFKNNCMMSKTK